jgi:ElaB/YqjD/DUF883 family membrane-anchored ribosome-binding protein
MAETLLEKEPVVEKHAQHYKEIFGERIKDGVELAKKVARTSKDAAEDFMEETTHRIKRHPTETVAGALATGLVIGTIIGLLIRRKK